MNEYARHMPWLREQAETFGDYAAFALQMSWRATSARQHERTRQTAEQCYRNARLAAHFGLRALKCAQLAVLEQEIAEWAAQAPLVTDSACCSLSSALQSDEYAKEV